MTDEEIKILREEIAKGIRETVNGKIDALAKAMDDHVKVCLPAIEQRDTDMARILPVLEAFETSERALEGAKTSGKVILWMAAFITAVGGAWLVIKQIFGF